MLFIRYGVSPWCDGEYQGMNNRNNRIIKNKKKGKKLRRARILAKIL